MLKFFGDRIPMANASKMSSSKGMCFNNMADKQRRLSLG